MRASTVMLHGLPVEPAAIVHLINHVVLPPKLPQEVDADIPKLEQNLLSLVQDVVLRMDRKTFPAWDAVSRMLLTLNDMRKPGDLDQGAVKFALAEMQVEDSLAIYFAAQNAGVLIRCKDETSTTFESFELSATSESVMSTSGRQIRTFPGRAVACSSNIFFESGFLTEMARTLSRLNDESVSLYEPTSRKAGNTVQEIRDSTHPGLVNDYLMTMICALGQNEDVQTLKKRTRDDVCWTAALLPWRRAPFWLFLRVSIEITLFRQSPENARKQYKLFMIHLVARLLELAYQHKISPDMISVVHIKLARRVFKYEASYGQLTSPVVEGVSTMACETLRGVWSQIIRGGTAALEKLPAITVKDTISLSLPGSRSDLVRALEPPTISTKRHSFIPPTCRRIPSDSTVLPSLQSSGEQPIILLADVELWVETKLQGWVENVLRTNLEVSDNLYMLIKNYWNLVVTHYGCSFIEKSIALLTIAELWVALDKICTTKIPLLLKYPPEIPQDLFAPLLLPKAGQMYRLSSIETYIESRSSKASSTTSSVFALPSSGSFTVRYYDASPSLQQLRLTINQHDQQKRDDKLRELERLNREHKILSDRYESLSHTMVTRYGESTHRDFDCLKCQVKMKADAMRIYVNEKSLPENVDQAKAAIFELAAPIEFSAWRDATWLILDDICQRNSQVSAEERAYTTVLAYNQLQPYVVPKVRQPCLTLGSTTNPFLQSHYKQRPLPALPKDVCVTNGLRYEMWDQNGRAWLGTSKGCLSIKRYCTLALPPGPYQNLEWALRTFYHTSNEVMARQSECADQLELREYIAFGNFRSGERIQWMNMLRELGSSSLSHNQAPVTILMLQTAWEAGTASQDAYRVAHEQLRDAEFCKEFLSMLQRRLNDIESNWQEQQSMMTVIQLGLRLLSLVSSAELQTKCIQFLKATRSICIRWSRQIQIHTSEISDGEEAQAKAIVLLLNAAILCYSTLDVDVRHIPAVLASHDDVSAAIEIRAIICDNTPTSRSDLPQLLQQSLLHTQKVAHKLEPYLLEIIRHDSGGLNKAVKQLWSGADLHATWCLPAPGIRAKHHSWLCSENVSVSDGSTRMVHLNLLDGDLLVNGKPIGKIPKEMRRHSLFQQIFGSRALQVYSSTMVGMDYGVSQNIEEHEVHIGVRDQKILIRAIRDGKIYQALPQTTFAGDLPNHFVSGFTHWLDETTGAVEFRPLDKQWLPSMRNPLLKFTDTNLATATAELCPNPDQAMDSQDNIVDPFSGIGKAVIRMLSVLDDSPYVEMVMNRSKPKELKVYLRRYNLHFLVKSSGELVSLEYDAVVDTQQDIGTMIGLKNKLVLRDTLPAGGPHERRVIIPYGKPYVERIHSHVSVLIERETGLKQRYFVYDVERHLCKLKGQQDTLGTLHKAFLHALTSFCLPDPFTGRTGTEESIAILQEASLFSSTPLDSDEFEVLSSIASLTPYRSYYPQHKHSMQEVVWNGALSFISQHDEFFPAATAIVEHHKATQSLYTASESMSWEGRGDRFLVKRARLHNSTLVRSHAMMVATNDEDVIYHGRDSPNANLRASHVYEVACLVKQWPARLATHTDLVTLLKRWGNISGYHSSRFSIDSFEKLSTLLFHEHWGRLYEYCRQAQRSTMTYPLMFKFCAIALGKSADIDLTIRTLLAFAFSGFFRNIEPPASQKSYNLGNGFSLSRAKVLGVVNKNAKEIELSVSATSDQLAQHWRKLASQTDQCGQLSAAICAQWPAETITVAHNRYALIEVKDVRRQCQSLFDEWHKNRRFLEHAQIISDRLLQMQAPHIMYQVPSQSLSAWPRDFTFYPYPDMISLIRNSDCSDLVKVKVSSRPIVMSSPTALEDTSQVEGLVTSLISHPDSTHQGYAKNLLDSVRALEGRKLDLESCPFQQTGSQFEKYREDLTKTVSDMLNRIRTFISPTTVAEVILQNTDLWPRISLQSLLAQLSSRKVKSLPNRWKSVLIYLGVNVASLQRAERMVKLRESANHRGLWKELKHPGREGWSPIEYPSWLLLEVENNITIRPLQAKVAREMLAPRSGSNSVLQLNMGEGKSSVIIPMLATVLANGEQLVRVIVLKPLLRQTEHVLTQKLGGLLDHRVCHLPFSRKTEINSSKIDVLNNAFHQNARDCGVMIILPEEILSMRLMTTEQMLAVSSLASKVLNTHRWLKSHARDLLDESDEILSVRSQLIYPVGGQHILDGKSERWTIAQALLQRAAFHASKIAEKDPSQLKLDKGIKSFPLMKFMCPTVGEVLNKLLVKDAMKGLVGGISFDYYDEETRNAIESYIGERKSSPLPLEKMSNLHQNALLILRGLIAHDILQFALQRKRWLVDYGLAPERCLMAVPYRAKGVPSTNSEFGHPDVGILLTCLSYYYTGITLKQMYVCFGILSKDANAQDIYLAWAAACQNLPPKLASFDAVNLDDQRQCELVVFPQMQYNIEIIHFYLNYVVFPKEGKEFEKRISGSAWDIPSEAGDSKLLTTGFSGTNDNRAVLPFSITQDDLFELRHTNAMVLNLMLREENRTYIPAMSTEDSNLGVMKLLSLVVEQTPRITVLIDVGAQVLEATNLDLVNSWLELEECAPAAVYFNDEDEAMVLDRTGSTTPLRVSPFQGKLKGCLIYLDEVHTRGIDLAIPAHARGAVTLGPRMVKDRLMQACMRMRGLGNGQSLCFIAPPEVHRSISDLRGTSHSFTSFDVLAWSMEMTCQSLENARPLRAMHGLEYSRQQKIINTYLPASLCSTDITSNSEKMKQFWEAIQDNDTQSLDLLYGIHDMRIGAIQALLDRTSDNPLMKHLVNEYDAMNKTILEDSNLNTEQERELAHEIERERQIERPPQVKPLVPKISKGLEQYIQSGKPEDLAKCDVKTELEALERTAARTIDPRLESNFLKILVTRDFVYSVQPHVSKQRVDEYLRTVNWVVSSPQTDKLLIISPHEANELLPMFSMHKKVRLHVFAARISKNMAPFGELKFWTINPMFNSPSPSIHAMRDLNLFSGSLYVETLVKYEKLCHFLGIVTPSTRPSKGEIGTDGFVGPRTRQQIGWPEDCPFTHSPLQFLRELLSLRMHGQEFDHSHLGALLNGRALREGAFEDSAARGFVEKKEVDE